MEKVAKTKAITCTWVKPQRLFLTLKLPSYHPSILPSIPTSPFPPLFYMILILILPCHSFCRESIGSLLPHSFFSFQIPERPAATRTRKRRKTRTRRARPGRLPPSDQPRADEGPLLRTGGKHLSLLTVQHPLPQGPLEGLPLPLRTSEQ